MTVSYSTNLGLALPAQGDWAGSWGTNQNQFITQYLDAAIAGAQVISGSQTAVTLSTTNGLALSQAGSGPTGSAQYAVINCTGNPASMLTITAPLTDKTYVIINATSTNQAVKIVGIGPTTGVTVAAARAAMVAWNGADFVLVATTDASKLTGVLGVANGGTGLSSFTANGLLYASGTGTLATSSDFIFNGSQVGILNASPAATLDVGGSAIIGSTSVASGITIFRRATIPTSGATFSNLIFASTTDGTALQAGAAIIARASEAWTGSGTGTRLVFRTATNGAVGPSDKMTLENNGDLAVSGAITSNSVAVVTTTGTQALTNKTISGANNTLSNIANSSLANSSITINGNSVSLGGSTTVTATATNALTIGTGLSGGSYNGSSAVTIAIDSSVATLTGAQTLTNKTLASPVLSGTPTAPTASQGTNTTQVATTAFVRQALPGTTAGDIGSYMLATYSGPNTVNFGDTVVSSFPSAQYLQPVNLSATSVGATVNGTWRCLGQVVTYGNNPGPYSTAQIQAGSTLWLRIS